MMLKFVAARDTLVPVPGAAQVAGQPPRYINRMLVDAGFPAHDKPFAIDAADKAARRLVAKCQTGDLFAADEATARECGVQFMERELVGGEWTQKPASAAAKREKGDQ